MEYIRADVLIGNGTKLNVFSNLILLCFWKCKNTNGYNLPTRSLFAYSHTANWSSVRLHR